MKYLSATQFKAAVKSGAPIDALITKATVATPEVTGERTVKFTISTDAVDRDNDVIDQKGWKLDNYRKNAVVLWAHNDKEAPIGRVTDLGIEDGALRALVEFVPADNSWVGQKAEGILQLCKQGFVNACSVGFMPLECAPSEDKARGGDGWNPGYDIKRQELYELSLCPIPANPEALMERPNTSGPKAIETIDSALPLNNQPRAKRQRVLRFYQAIGAH